MFYVNTQIINKEFFSIFIDKLIELIVPTLLPFLVHHSKRLVYYNFNIKMSKEKEQKIARKLFQIGASSDCSKENISEAKILQ